MPGTFQGQAGEAAAQLSGDDGLLAAAAILREFADAAHADVAAQAAALGFAADRRNYRPLWRDTAGRLRWNLWTLPGGLHPYIHVNAAAAALGTDAKRAVRALDPLPTLAHLFEILDLTLDGWEFARVRPDTDAATLAHRLIATARDLRAAMSDEPPLPQPVREWMRRNNTINVYDPSSPAVVGGFNPGKEMREALLA
ncbi:hypothetical protein Ade02nite_57570 [Paractinoplanes deccanensis]|uniref:Uncharacterized protein n=1 Tax=Paractinoplanes deccanensis TaxID=113561 RepID=A0ABQ3YAX6_9ACTN|nr:hypothetical protein Ade02nite_57570 [Actinoplanes deccanensis]